MTPILHSLLETDLYKFTMWQTMLHRHPQAQAEYRFVCRNAPAFPLSELLDDVNEQLDHLCALSFTEDELAYIGALRYMKADFVDFLRIFRFQRRFIRASVAADGRTLEIVAEGPQVHVMGFEIYVLAIVNELYFRRADSAAALAEGRTRLRAKVAALREFGAREPVRAHPFEFFDFGVRRRFSAAWQEEVVRTLKDEAPAFFKGTSNVHLAKKYGLVAIGTMAHDTRELMGMDIHPRMRVAWTSAQSNSERHRVDTDGCSDISGSKLLTGRASSRWAALLSTGSASASGSRWTTGFDRRSRRPSTGRGTSACAPWGARSADGPVVHGRARVPSQLEPRVFSLPC